MPKKIYKRRTNRKPAYKRKRFGKTKRYTQRNRITTHPVASRYITKLKYCQQGSLSLTSGFLSGNAWNLNSLYDPDRTGTGHQPFGHDTLAALYNRYRVYKVTGSIHLTTPTSAIPITVGLIAANDVPVYSNIEHMMETPGSKITQLNHQTDVKTIRFSYYLPAVNGVSNSEYRSTTHTGAIFGNNPSETICLALQAGCASSTATLNYSLTLIYHAEMGDPKDIAQS